MENYLKSGIEKNYLIWDEISKQKESWESAIDKFDEIKEMILKNFKDHNNIYFIGSGSSYHLALLAKLTYDTVFDKKSTCSTSSDFIIHSKNYIKKNSDKDKFILMSRSGETKDTLIASKLIKELKGFSLAITTFPDTSLEKNCDYKIILEKSQEKAMTSTRFETSIAIFLLNLIFDLSNNSTFMKDIISNKDRFFENFKKYAEIIFKIIDGNNFKRFSFLGSGPFYSIARESALKVKEMSITSTEFFQSLEYRHGHNTITDKDSLVVLFISDAGFDYEIDALKELQNFGAKILLIGDNSKLNDLKKRFDYVINLDLGANELVRPVFFYTFGQLLGFYQALKKNIDPSNPRYLTYHISF